jgi:hypothetical protein
VGKNKDNSLLEKFKVTLTEQFILTDMMIELPNLQEGLGLDIFSNPLCGGEMLELTFTTMCNRVNNFS